MPKKPAPLYSAGDQVTAHGLTYTVRSVKWKPQRPNSFRCNAYEYEMNNGGIWFMENELAPAASTPVDVPLPSAMTTPVAIANLIYRLKISDIPVLACQITSTTGAELQAERRLIEAQILREVGEALLAQGNYEAARSAIGLLGQATVAKQLGISRQAVHQLVNRYAARTLAWDKKKA